MVLSVGLLEVGLRSLVLFCLSVLMVACTNSRFSHDDPAQLAGIGPVFAWAEPALVDTGTNANLVAIDSGFRRELEEALLSRGYSLQRFSGADWLLRYSYFESRDIDQGGILSPQDQLARSRQTSREPSLSAVHTHHIPAELIYDSLQLEVLDAASGEVVWQGISSRLRDREPGGPDQVLATLKRLASPLLRVIPAAG